MPFFGQPQKIIPQNVSFFMTAKINYTKKGFGLQPQKLVPQKLIPQMDLGYSLSLITGFIQIFISIFPDFP